MRIIFLHLLLNATYLSKISQRSAGHTTLKEPIVASILCRASNPCLVHMKPCEPFTRFNILIATKTNHINKHY
ncbi:hypothetical protein Hanom_Chr01g00083461 [Helianthus anomalus]